MISFKNNTGLTLVELLVSVGVTVLLLGGLSSYVTSMIESHQREEFYTSIQKVLTFFRSTRYHALSNAPTDVVGAPFGLYLKKEEDHLTLIHFIDDHNGVSSGINGVYDEGSDTLLEEGEISFLHLKIFFEDDSGGDLGDEFYFFFSPITATMTMKNALFGTDYKTMGIAFSYKNRKLDRRICLNRISRFLEISSNPSCI